MKTTKAEHRKAGAEAPAKAQNEGEVRTVLSEDEAQDTFENAGTLAADVIRELAARAKAEK